MEISEVGIWDIPDEILRKIFSYLGARTVLTIVVDVSIKWRSIIEFDFLFWNNLQLVVQLDNFLHTSCLYMLPFNSHPLTSRTVNEKFIEVQKCEEESEIIVGENDLWRVAKVRCLKLKGRHTELTYSLEFIAKILDIISNTCKDVVKVECCNCFGNAIGLLLMLLNKRFSNLNEIKYGVNTGWLVPYQKPVLLNFKYLNTVICHDYRFTRTDFYSIVEGCSQLNSLWVLFTRSIRNDDIIYLLEKNRETMRELGIGLTSVADSVLHKVQECYSLKVLFITDARYITAVGLNQLTNLPNLKYLSLHRARFHPDVLSKWISTSTIPANLAVLDLNDYYFKEIDCLHQISQKCLIKFSNDVNKAIFQPSKPGKSAVHWMYYNVL